MDVVLEVKAKTEKVLVGMKRLAPAENGVVVTTATMPRPPLPLARTRNRKSPPVTPATNATANTPHPNAHHFPKTAKSIKTPGGTMGPTTTTPNPTKPR